MSGFSKPIIKVLEERIAHQSAEIGSATVTAAAFCANQGCGKPLDTVGKPKWCKSCRAAYQRERQVLYAEETEAIGWRRGAEAMKAVLLAALLGAHPNGRMLVHEVVWFVNSAELPEFPRATASKTE
jgi:hypothetical protein